MAALPCSKTPPGPLPDWTTPTDSHKFGFLKKNANLTRGEVARRPLPASGRVRAIVRVGVRVVRVGDGLGREAATFR